MQISIIPELVEHDNGGGGGVRLFKYIIDRHMHISTVVAVDVVATTIACRLHRKPIDSVFEYFFYYFGFVIYILGCNWKQYWFNANFLFDRCSFCHIAFFPSLFIFSIHFFST